MLQNNICTIIFGGLHYERLKQCINFQTLCIKQIIRVYTIVLLPIIYGSHQNVIFICTHVHLHR